MTPIEVDDQNFSMSGDLTFTCGEVAARLPWDGGAA
jgi:hypothetical protein